MPILLVNTLEREEIGQEKLSNGRIPDHYKNTVQCPHFHKTQNIKYEEGKNIPSIS